jgi:DNA mismatch repair protein MutL
VGRIRVLSDTLINRIAAGEVVERPASVVKELVENSLDADARAIAVRLERGGRERIEVADDGCGMDRDDALLALERHATSKLGALEDLEAIGTLGFRGEALASIAAVSRLTLTTASDDSGAGTEVELHGGCVQAVREIGRSRGTTIRVDRLFYNVPARRKFLRAESTELSHAVRWLTRYALANAPRRFLLEQGGRRILDAPPAADRRERIAQLFGRDFTERLLPFERRLDSLVVSGFAGRPVDSLPRRDAQHVFVNGRAVQDRVLAHAVAQAYGNTVPSGRFPPLLLFIDIDPSWVDVNVHPQKTEVRFVQSSVLHDVVREALAGALPQPAAVPSLADLRPERPRQEAVRRAALSYLDLRVDPPRCTAVFEAAPPSASRGPAAVPTLAGHAAAGSDAAVAPGEGGPAVPIGQLHESYILAGDARGLVLVDQHAAHERVLFERFVRQAEADHVEIQQLLFPVTVELPPHAMALFEQEAHEFRRLGLHAEPFGDDAVRIDAVIKIHHPLSLDAMRALLDELSATDNPTTCPHGRPVLFRLTIEEIERAFRRR